MADFDTTSDLIDRNYQIFYWQHKKYCYCLHYCIDCINLILFAFHRLASFWKDFLWCSFVCYMIISGHFYITAHTVYLPHLISIRKYKCKSTGCDCGSEKIYFFKNMLQLVVPSVVTMSEYPVEIDYESPWMHWFSW